MYPTTGGVSDSAIAHIQTADDQPDNGKLESPSVSDRTTTNPLIHGGIECPENTTTNTPEIQITVSTT